MSGFTCLSCGGTVGNTVGSRRWSKQIIPHTTLCSRRRECSDCQTRITTYELTETDAQVLFEAVKVLAALRHLFSNIIDSVLK